MSLQPITNSRSSVSIVQGQRSAHPRAVIIGRFVSSLPGASVLVNRIKSVAFAALSSNFAWIVSRNLSEHNIQIRPTQHLKKLLVSLKRAAQFYTPRDVALFGASRMSDNRSSQSLSQKLENVRNKLMLSTTGLHAKTELLRTIEAVLKSSETCLEIARQAVAKLDAKLSVENLEDLVRETQALLVLEGPMRNKLIPLEAKLQAGELIIKEARDQLPVLSAEKAEFSLRLRDLEGSDIIQGTLFCPFSGVPMGDALRWQRGNGPVVYFSAAFLNIRITGGKFHLSGRLDELAPKLARVFDMPANTLLELLRADFNKYLEDHLFRHLQLDLALSSLAQKNVSSVTQFTEEDLRCGVCLDVMENNRLLPCGHSYSQEGLQNQTRCPCCRAPFHTTAANSHLNRLARAWKDNPNELKAKLLKIEKFLEKLTGEYQQQMHEIRVVQAEIDNGVYFLGELEKLKEAMASIRKDLNSIVSNDQLSLSDLLAAVQNKRQNTIQDLNQFAREVSDVQIELKEMETELELTETMKQQTDQGCEELILSERPAFLFWESQYLSFLQGEIDSVKSQMELTENLHLFIPRSLVS